MRTFSFVCLTVAILACSKSFAADMVPVQPDSFASGVARQTTYVYDDGENDEEKYYVPSAEMLKKKELAAAAAPTAEAPPVITPAPLEPSGDAPAGSGESCRCDSCNGCAGSDESWCDCAGDFSLDKALGWECCPYNIGGWTEMGYTTNNVPLSQAYNDLLSFSDVPDNVNLYQQWLYVERTTDGSCGWDLGGRDRRDLRHRRPESAVVRQSRSRKSQPRLLRRLLGP